MLGKLVPCGGGPPILLLKPRLLVGRQRSCDIPLAFPTVSSRHCELEWADGAWFVRDLGSRHGVRVDGVACTAGRLPPGSVLWIAGLRFEVAYASPAAAPQPQAQPKGPQFSQSLLE